MEDLVAMALTLFTRLLADSGERRYGTVASTNSEHDSSPIVSTKIRLDGKYVLRIANLGMTAKLDVIDRFLADEILIEAVAVDDTLAVISEYATRRRVVVFPISFVDFKLSLGSEMTISFVDRVVRQALYP